MNIIVRTLGGATVFRPDTTWERYSRDFYPPESVEALSGSVVLFAHISRPGKCVGEKFAKRYYDSLGYGLLLYPQSGLPLQAESYAQALCMDHTSVLTLPSDSSTESLELRIEGKEVFTHGAPSEPIIAKALVEATSTTLLRNGDLLCAEISPFIPIMKKGEGNVRVEGITPGGKAFDFEVITG